MISSTFSDNELWLRISESFWLSTNKSSWASVPTVLVSRLRRCRSDINLGSCVSYWSSSSSSLSSSGSSCSPPSPSSGLFSLRILLAFLFRFLIFLICFQSTRFLLRKFANSSFDSSYSTISLSSFWRTISASPNKFVRAYCILTF